MLSYAAKTDLGNERINNEDCYLANPDLCLWIMADGVGGQDAGEVASKIACETIQEQVSSGAGLVDSINTAHKAIKNSYVDKGIGRPGMATTVVVLVIHGNEYQVAWVGDSRAYLWCQGNLKQITHDQSLVQRLVDEKIITEEEALIHPKRNLVIQALGQNNLEELDVESVMGSFNDGDKILLCSDGLTDYVHDKQLNELMALYSNHNILVDKLVEAALATAGRDNITVMVVNLSSKQINDTRSMPIDSVEKALAVNRGHWPRSLISIVVAVLIAAVLIAGFLTS